MKTGLKLNRLLKYIQSMTEEEIREVFKDNAIVTTESDIDVFDDDNTFEIVDPKSFVKSSTDMVCITKERYEELLNKEEKLSITEKAYEELRKILTGGY